MAGEAQGQSSITGGCNQQSCWNDLEEIISACFDAANGKLFTTGTACDFPNCESWFWLSIGSTPEN
jgi:hypothetical protein